MEYTDIEKQALALMQRTDFKNLSKADAVSIFSQLNQLRPEVASQIISQFPEFANLLLSSMHEYKEILGDVIASDDESLKQLYSIVEKDADSSSQSRELFYDLASRVHADLSKCLDDPNMTPEDKQGILDREVEIMKIASAKDTEIREHESEALRIADKKDSEKRHFNWGAITAASSVVMIGLGIGASILGGNFNLRLPK